MTATATSSLTARTPKFLLLSGIVVALTGILYARFGGDSAKPDPSQFPLGQYPILQNANMSQFNQLIGSPKAGRKHNSFILFNAVTPGAGCQICPGVDKDFKAVVQKISSKDHLKRNLAFATVELGHSRDIFTLMKIQTAPWLMFFKAFEPGQTPPEPVAFNIRKAMNHDTIIDFIQENQKERLVLHAPKSKEQLAMQVVGGLALVGAIYLGIAGQLNAVIYNPWIAFLLTTAFIVLMNAGIMFCRIRKIPISLAGYTFKNAISPGMQSQTGAEVWYVSGLTLINAFAAVVLGDAVPRIKNPVGKRIAALIFTAVMTFGFHTHINMAKIKVPGYPYELFSKQF